jgi:hypothetical protein
MRTLIAFVLTVLAPAAVAQTNPAPSDLTNAQAVEPLKDIQGALKDCFKAERDSNPDLPGQVVLSYTITEDGKPINVELDSLGGRPVVGCVQAAVATLRWPQFTGQRKQVSVPFTLSNPHSASIFAVAVGATSSSPQSTFEGGLARSEIQEVVAAKMTRIKRCYEAELEWQHDLAGKVTLHWVIRSTGDVGEVVVILDTMGKESLTRCLVAAIQPMLFPRPKGGGVVNVTYPFVFGTTGTVTTPVTIGAMTRAQVSGGLAHEVVEVILNALAFETCADATAGHVERADLRFVVAPMARSGRPRHRGRRW